MNTLMWGGGGMDEDLRLATLATDERGVFFKMSW